MFKEWLKRNIAITLIIIHIPMIIAAVLLGLHRVESAPYWIYLIGVGVGFLLHKYLKDKGIL